MTSAQPGDPPLARLFAMGYRVLIDGLHERLNAKGWTDVRPSFGFVLLAARHQPTTSTEVAALMGMTKQAASKLIAAMTEVGYLQSCRDSPDDARQRPVELTRRGHQLVAAVERIYAQLESEWADAIGATNVERVRRDVARALRAAHGGELPPVRPTL